MDKALKAVRMIYANSTKHDWPTDIWDAIEEALAQPEQEPVAWAEFDGEGGYHFRAYENNEDYAEQWDKRNPNHVGWVKPLYATPPQRTWVGLTDEDVRQCSRDVVAGGSENSVDRFAYAIEAKLKEKNT